MRTRFFLKKRDLLHLLIFATGDPVFLLKRAKTPVIYRVFSGYYVSVYT